MGKYLDEMKRMTVDPACHRLGEIADQLTARLDEIERRCCYDVDARHPPADPDRPSSPQ